jgi:hypothetical protein
MSQSTWWRLTSRMLLLIVVSGLLTSGNLAAQSQEEASIIGQVKDPSGAPLPGVTVMAKSPSLQVPSIATVTNSQGEYRLSPLPIGIYEVSYELSGFGVVRRADIRLTVGFTARIDIQMQIGQVEETLTVTGASPIVDVTSAATRTQLTHESLQLVPTTRSGLISLMALAPGVRPNLDVGGDQFNATIQFRSFGQTGESWQAVEGVVTTSPNSGNQGGNYWDSNAFEEAKIQTVGSGANVPVRGVNINAVIRSGGNDFHGSASLAATSQTFENNNVSPAQAALAPSLTQGNPINSRSDWDGDLGGRLIRDKLWFYTSERYRQETDQTLGCFQDDGTTPCVAKNSLTYSTAKVTYQPNPSNRLIAFSQFTYKYTMSGGSRLSSYDSRTSYTIPIFTDKVEWQHVKGNVVTSVQFGLFDWTRQTTGYYSSQVAKSDNKTSIVTGIATGASLGPQPEYRYQPRANLTWYKPEWFGGNHTLQFSAGYQWIRTDVGYHFLPPQNYSLVFSNSAPTTATFYNYPASGSIIPIDYVRYMELSAEDSWAIKRRLTLNLGLRFAHNPGNIPAQCSPAAGGPLAAVFPGACYPEIHYNTWNPLVPRVHAAFDVTGNGKTVLSAGWGRFAHMRQTDELSIANQNYPASYTYNWHDLNTNGLYDPGEVNLDPNAIGGDFVSSSITGTAATLTYGVVNPNEQEPMSDEYSVQFQRELMPSFAMRLTGVYSHNWNNYALQNLLRPPSAYNIPVSLPIPMPDGVTPSGQNITFYEYSSALNGLAFQKPTLVNNPAADAHFTSFEVAVVKRLSHRWQFDASFSMTQRHEPIPVDSGTGLTLTVTSDNPNSYINTADYTKEWLGRASGLYQMPWGVSLSGTFESRSGVPYARTFTFSGKGTPNATAFPTITLNVEPYGSERLPEINLFNFRLEKTIPLVARTKLSVRGNVYNAFNANPPTSVTALSGPNYGIPAAILLPRIFELSGVFSF